MERTEDGGDGDGDAADKPPLLPQYVEMTEKEKVALVEGCFFFALVWSVGCTGDGPARAGFDKFVRTIADGGTPKGYEEFLPATRPKVSIKLPPPPREAAAPAVDGADAPRGRSAAAGEPCGSVFDFFFDREERVWLPWSATITPQQLAIAPDANFVDILVPTKDSAQVCHAMYQLHSTRILDDYIPCLGAL